MEVPPNRQSVGKPSPETGLVLLLLAVAPLGSAALAFVRPRDDLVADGRALCQFSQFRG